MDSIKIILDALLRKIPVYFKMGALLFLMLVLLIPVNMIDNMIGERRYRQAEVAGEISEIWGREQSLFGPVLILPYRETVEIRHNDGSSSLQPNEGRVFLMPESLKIAARIDPEIRYRGIFETIVYRGDIAFEGSFRRPDFEELGIAGAEIIWNRAILALSVSDLRGTQGDLRMEAGNYEAGFTPGTTSDVLGGGVSAVAGGALPRGLSDKTDLKFSFSLDIAGSERILFTPAAKETTVTLNSPWRHPRFEGAWLPEKRTIGSQGFEARWSVSWYGRDLPQQWLEGSSAAVRLDSRIRDTRFGVSLITPVDFYLKSERSVKYAILFVLLIFATVFILEVAVPVRVHLIQYALVGFAKTMFYLLLLALSEVVGFGSGFLVAALVSTAMIAFYLGYSARSRVLGIQVTAVLAGIYGFLYVVLQLEDYALLVGALGLVAALAAVMYATRNIDWYRLGPSANGGKEESAET
ncbi:MAG: cell envelope integrity protein CreD [Alphaproteobacteria bacterium]|nr:cell envelope integrity protein CreD [Alphaproteobacteria bacterium]